ncbi:translation initiation factor IF-2 [Granulicella sp. WH15]|uniref:translation initiation factor IF-2 n=1 Tax=Granulicella sp. WH15 TaxID=2602070 RepID=UPI00136775BA|nr:translation initiation factor IF-2 [Granulicella sp. WH15]QHN02388.1 translation initiation factor IF-2 [Granulicella sp. WH15]
MSKVRINDLARELEVKSRPILDALEALGVTGKTHSSSIEEDQAERVRGYFNGGNRGSSANRPAEPARRFNLSNVSKPGDAMRAILERKQAENAAKNAPPQRPAVVAAPVAAAPAVSVARPAVAAPVAGAPATSVVAAPAPTAVPVAPAAPAAATPVATAPVAPRVQPPVAAAPAPNTPPAPRRIVPLPNQGARIVAPPPAAGGPAIASRPPAQTVVVRPPVAGATPANSPLSRPAGTAPVVVAAPAPRPAVAAPVAAASPTPAATPVAAAPAAPAAAQPAAPAPATPVAEPVAAATAPAAEAPAAPAPPATPAAPARRIIMPQTGPRPIYTAPAPVPGAPPRGRPIFERPRPGSMGGPGAPGSRPGMGGPMAPGARRPMHPTRSYPGGPSGPGGPGGPPRPGFAPGSRPGFPPRPGFGGPRPGGAPGAPGAMPGPGETPGGQRPARPGQRRGGQRYEKVKEGPMKGFQPPPRYGGIQMSREPLPITKTITVTEGISVKDLAEKLDVRGKDLIAILLMKGVFVTVNQSLDGELVKDVARQFGADAQVISVEEQLENEAIEGFLEDTTGMVEIVRAPVVTIMGHVDHGKTSLLDAIRSTDVAGGEAGGITQHIGAYKVHVTKPDSPAFGREIVFLDTPGHEAFTRMRARGAKVTDIVVIVVAADDGVMPQTLEAIDHARAAKVPIIVAVNKIDKPDANPAKIIQQLAARGLQPSNQGGDTEFVEVSAKKHLNLDKLEEMICLVADVNEQKAQPDRPAVGTVIEAKLDRGRGAVASILVQNGTLKLGDSYIVGNTFGKIRAMFDDRGRPIETAGPSTPVEILGLEGMPDAGDTFIVMADRDKAKGIAQYRKMKEREAQLAKSARVSLEGLAEQIKQAGTKDLNLIVKGDVQGSVEVIAEDLQHMSTEKIRVRVLHSGVGAITESDVLLASASNAVIIGFNVRPDRNSAEVAARENVEIRLHSIIYELRDEIEKAMYGLLDPVFKENYSGRAEVLNVFKITKVGQIAGCRVTDGLIKRSSQARLLRDGVEVWKGKISSLKRFKDDVSEVRDGVECGIDLAGHKDIRVGDIIETYTTEKLEAELGQNTLAAKKAEKAEKEREALATNA